LGFPAVFHRTAAPPAAATAGAAPRGGGRGSLFKQRLMEAGAPFCEAPIAAGASYHAVASSHPAFPRHHRMLPSDAAGRASLARAAGFSSAAELDALDSTADATLAAMSERELADAVEEARAFLGHPRPVALRKNCRTQFSRVEILHCDRARPLLPPRRKWQCRHRREPFPPCHPPSKPAPTPGLQLKLST
jgi:hypothetical protein